MAEPLDTIAERLFRSVLAPLVLGGPLRTGHAIGARAALALAERAPRPADLDLASRVDLGRVAVARHLVPVDRLDDIDGETWALAAALHDLFQVASPGWVRRSAPKRLLDLTLATLERVPPVRSAREALARHTWFARLVSVRRRDTAVSWWVGSREFLGSEPPKRLLLWSDVRRVSVERQERTLCELLTHGGVRELASAFEAAVSRFLRATPLTDLATASHRTPAFAWSPETLALVRTPAARTLALRAVALSPLDELDAALGAATRTLLGAHAWREASTALDFLGHRALSAAQESAAWPGAIDGPDDTAFARATGALVARKWLDEGALVLSESERRRLTPIFDAAAKVSAAREISELTGVPRPTPTPPERRPEPPRPAKLASG